MTTLTCDHCESEIDVAKDPKCVVYDPSGATDVSCAECRERIYYRGLESWSRYQIKRGWRA